MVPVSALYYLPLPQTFNIFIIHIFNKKVLSVDQSIKHDFKSQKSLFNALFFFFFLQLSILFCYKKEFGFINLSTVVFYIFTKFEVF